MTDRLCTFPGQREEALMAYVYEDMSASELATFKAHLAACEVCRTELAGLGRVRERLADWAPPEPRRALVQPQNRRSGVWAAVEAVPAWAQLAAAVLVLGVSAGAANLRVTYNNEGLSVRTGWSGEIAGNQSAPAPQSVPEVAATERTPVEPAATRAELVALEQSLRDEIAKTQAVGPSVVKETRTLIAESERRQQTELALRIGTVIQDVRAQREADNASINRLVRTSVSSADVQAQQTREMMKQLATRVSAQSQQR